jgi:xanthine dehydrogenase YagS FAD-binding subunit
MRAFQFKAAATPSDAVGSGADTAFIAGGTNLIDLMKLDVVTPMRLVDLGPLSFRGIALDSSGLHIGALEKMADVAGDPRVVKEYPVISQALLKSASAQIRNMATIGGNLMQRTRCGYFRDTDSPCNKRVPGSGCPALEGENRMHAIFGVSDSCCATHPSDLAVALVALDSVLKLQGPQGSREVKLEDFYLLPGSTPDREHDIQSGEIITEIFVPGKAWASRSGYLKIRDRESYELALTSAAVVLDLDGSTVRDARIAVGGVGTKPWSLPVVAEALKGRTANRKAFEAATEQAAEGARILSQNGFKVSLVKKTILRALSEVGGVA